ncbi:MAG TPA: nucleotide exchange factor GrpE [Candidatus Ozemobacteraceae bacterium]|mgnify:CR=1 FL=1|nr:nucleotide exchange factor GrpE [Candidatus Ozemobacteraceae bacterium]
MEPTNNTQTGAGADASTKAGEAFEGKQTPQQPGSSDAPPTAAGSAGDVPPAPEKDSPGPASAPASELEKELSRVKKELDEAQKSYLRARADYDNLKRRSANDFLNASSEGAIGIVKKLLPVLDSFESALKQLQNANVDKKFRDGVEMLYMQFSDTLEKEGLKPIAAKGKKFDPNEHEAMTRGQTDEYEDEVVMQEFVKGYKFRERVIRLASVQVNSK